MKTGLRVELGRYTCQANKVMRPWVPYSLKKIPVFKNIATMPSGKTNLMDFTLYEFTTVFSLRLSILNAFEQFSGFPGEHQYSPGRVTDTTQFGK